MAADSHDLLELAMDGLFRRRGVLDPSRSVPGLGASVSESLALSYLVDGEAAQHELGTYLGLEKSTVSRLVVGMIDKGWAKRARDPGNRRYQKVVLTEQGRQAAAQIAEAMRQRHERWLAALTPREQEALAVGLPALVRAMTDELGPDVDERLGSSGHAEPPDSAPHGGSAPGTRAVGAAHADSEPAAPGSTDSEGADPEGADPAKPARPPTLPVATAKPRPARQRTVGRSAP